MAKTVFDGNRNSHYDSGLITKEVHDYYGQSLRTIDTRSVVDQYFSHFRTQYDGSNKPTLVSYYRGTKHHKTSFNTVGASAALDGTYFTIRSAPDNQVWVVWFNLDNSSTIPNVSGAKYLEIPVSTGDNATVVAIAITLTINALAKDYFYVTRNGVNLEIKTVGLGLVTNSNEVTSPFIFTQTAGDQELVKSIELSYVGSDPVYEGQVLKGYAYDIYSGKFLQKTEVSVDNLSIDVDLDASTDSVAIGNGANTLGVNADGSINVNVVQTDQVLKSYYNEITNIPAGVTEELITYTATSNIYLQKIEFSGSNIAQYELTIDGTTIDKKRTYFNGNMESVFNFDNGLNVSIGQIITVHVYHNRPEAGEFNARMQILE